MKILRVICSPRGRASESYRLSENIVGRLLKNDATALVVDRWVGDGHLPPIDVDYAIAQGGSVDVSQEGTAAVSEQLIQELERADVLIIATPMHNFTVPAALKLWIDHVVRVRRTFNVTPQGKVGLLPDRPLFVAASSGGRFSGENVRQPDFLTPYLKAVLAIIGLHDVSVFSVEGTAFGPDAVARARDVADEALGEHFASFQPDEQRHQLS
jgi:FMN-dependent NADH-azoreductase